MKRNTLLASVLAVIAGLIISTWGTLDNVSACVQAPGCKQIDQQPIGKLTTRHYGFPASYKTTVSFEPYNSDAKAKNYVGYAIASSTTQPTNIFLILINVVFWFPLFYFGIRRLSSKK